MMIGYVLQRFDQGGGYVAPPGQLRSHTHDIRKAWVFSTKEEAQKQQCVGNEFVVSIDSQFE